MTSKTSVREVETELSTDNYTSILESFFRSMSVIDDDEDLYYVIVSPPSEVGGSFKVKMALTKASNQLELFPNEG